MLDMPTNTVRKRFLVFVATKKQGIDAKKALFSSPIASFLSESKIPGTRRADNTATGIYLNHFKNNGCISNLDSTTNGSILGK
ncbi:MAG: hypothetical protein PWQ67_1487 [Clostridia bacterium]|jgi:hypothetical protein|nr:hypothetical protein [Clostridiales bacterium]MDN5323033.1 hypothetical protein [Clostridia bacterium]